MMRRHYENEAYNEEPIYDKQYLLEIWRMTPFSIQQRPLQLVTEAHVHRKLPAFSSYRHLD